MRVERVVHGELAVHVIEVIPADASETVSDRFEAYPFGSPISFGRVRRADNLRQLDECRVFVQMVALDYRVEGTVFAVVPELSAGNVENHSVSDSGPIGAVGQEDEFGI